MKRLNELLQELGISKVRLAKYLGVSRQMVYNYLELDDINKWPKEKKIMLYRLLDVKDANGSLDDIVVTTDYLMSVESRLNNVHQEDCNTEYVDIKNLNQDSQKLFSSISSLIKEKLVNDNAKRENYYTVLYLYNILKGIDTAPEIRYVFGYFSKNAGITDPEEYKFHEEKQFILEGILNTALNLYNNGGSSRSKLQEAHRRWVAEINARKEEEISRTQELTTVKLQALKELNYTKMDSENANEVIDKILEIMSKKS